MVFQNLDLGLQQILLENFYAKGKAYTIFILFAFSLIYLFYWKPYKEEETPFFSVGILRLATTMYSRFFLFFSLLFVFFITPEASFWGFFGSILNLLLPIFFITLIVSGVEFMVFGVHYMLDKMGMKTSDPRVMLFLKKINKRGRFE